MNSEDYVEDNYTVTMGILDIFLLILVIAGMYSPYSELIFYGL